MFKTILEYLIPVWYYASGSIQSIKYLHTRKKSIEILNNAKKNINSTRDLEDWYKNNNFKYSSDKVDLSSLPWVTISRLGGDCDDFMSLAYEILKDKKECYRALIYIKGSGHAIVIIKEDDEFVLMSNMDRIKGFKTIDEAARYFYQHYYQQKTKTILYLK
jgi:hypothetical protein